MNISYALTLLGGNQNVLINLMISFYKKYKDFPLEIEKMIKDSDNLELFHIFHTLKGLTGTLGAEELEQKSKNLETAFKKEKMDIEKTVLNEFTENLGQVLASIKDLNLISENKKIPKTTTKMSEFERQEEISRITKELSKRIKSGNFSAGEKLTLLESKINDSSLLSKIQKLEEPLANFDFDDAYDKLKEFCEKTDIIIE